MLGSISLGIGPKTASDLDTPAVGPNTTLQETKASPNIVVMTVKGPGDSLGLFSLDTLATGVYTKRGGIQDSDNASGNLEGTQSCANAAPSNHLPTPVWQACVRVACNPSSGPPGPVLLLRAKISGLRELVAAHPELESAVRNIAGQQETDLKVAEALRQLQMTSMSQMHQRQVKQQQQRLTSVTPQSQDI